MTRKQFLIYLGMIFISFFGIPSLLNKFPALPKPKKPVKHSPRTAFGRGAYGV
jgi:hypothetical protein